jgi:hypothetical protein
VGKKIEDTGERPACTDADALKKDLQSEPIK